MSTNQQFIQNVKQACFDVIATKGAFTRQDAVLIATKFGIKSTSFVLKLGESVLQSSGL